MDEGMKSYQDYVKDEADKLETSLSSDAINYDNSTLDRWVIEDPESLAAIES